MWTRARSPFDYSAPLPDWWERDVESMVAKDVNHPSVVFYSIGNEIPETGSPAGGLVAPCPRGEGSRAGPDTVRHQRRQRDARGQRRPEAARLRRRNGVRRRRGHQHDAWPTWAHDERARRVRRSSRSGPRSPSHVLDVAGITTSTAATSSTGAVPEPRHRRDRDLPDPHRPRLGGSSRQRPRHRRLHLDRLGLPRRGRHRPATPPTTRRAGVRRAVPVAARARAATSTSPATAPRLVLPGDRVRPAAPTRTSPCCRPETHGRKTVGHGPWSWSDTSAAGRGPAPRAPGHRRGLQRRRRGGAGAQRPRDRHRPSWPREPIQSGVRRHLPARRTHRHRHPQRTACRELHAHQRLERASPCTDSRER